MWFLYFALRSSEFLSIEERLQTLEQQNIFHSKSLEFIGTDPFIEIQSEKNGYEQNSIADANQANQKPIEAKKSNEVSSMQTIHSPKKY